MRYGYDDDAKDAFPILEETVKHGEMTVPNPAELTFQRMRFAGRQDALRQILRFRSQNGAILPHLTFSRCTGIHRSELCQLHERRLYVMSL